MNDRYTHIDYTFEAISRLRHLLREHERSGEEDTPFHLGIRAALEDFDADDRGEATAA